MTRFMDLNVDLGEGCPWDEPLFALATSASICCGRHAGGEAASVEALRRAKRLGVTVGAHPGYADRVDFGRVPQAISSSDVASLVRAQLDDLIGWSGRVGVPVRYIKPHGALYNQAQNEQPIAEGLVAGSHHLMLPIVGLPSGLLRQTVEAAGLRFVPEGFVDRRYDGDGRLVPRTHPDAVLRDFQEIEAQVERLLGRGEVETLCIHGDDEGSVALATRVRRQFDRLGVHPRSFA